jgi:hypothetical protein
MVVPMVDYGSAVWGHTPAASSKAFNTVQKIGAKAVTEAFRTVARGIAEAEAGLLPAKQRHQAKAAAAWIGIQTLPQGHPLATRQPKTTQRFPSPLLQLKKAANSPQADRLETILPYVLPPW